MFYRGKERRRPTMTARSGNRLPFGVSQPPPRRFLGWRAERNQRTRCRAMSLRKYATLLTVGIVFTVTLLHGFNNLTGTLLMVTLSCDAFTFDGYTPNVYTFDGYNNGGYTHDGCTFDIDTFDRYSFDGYSHVVLRHAYVYTWHHFLGPQYSE